MAGNSKAKTKAPKRGSNFLCRIANPTPEKVCEFVHRLPKQIMSEDEFKKQMGKEWFDNEHQAPEQWGLYCLSNGYYYPQFNRDISLVEADRYLNGWLKRLIVINPYTRFTKVNDKNLVLSIVNQLINNPGVNDLKTVMSNIIGGNDPFVINDIFVNSINNYSEVLKITTIDKANEKFSVDLVANYQEILKTKYMDKKDYLNLFNNIIDTKTKPVEPTEERTYFNSQEYAYMAAIKTKPFLILGGFSGTGKSLLVKLLAFATCPCDGILNLSETTPGNYLLVSVKPNWHDATDITGFRSSVNRNYYVTDFMRFLVKAKMYEDKKVPFFVCLDEMNLAPVEEYFADFLSVIESRKKREDGRIVTDPIISASVFNDKDYADDFNIFTKLGLTPTEEIKDITEFTAEIKESGNESDFFVESWLVDDLKREGLTIPSNVVIIGTVNMDDTTNSFSRKVIDRAMTFETIVGKFDDSYFDGDIALNYVKNPRKGELYISDEVRATQMLDECDFELEDKEKQEILAFINNINDDLEGSPFKVSYRILNETILLYRAKRKIKELLDEEGGFEKDVEFTTDLNSIFDDILMQKVLPRIEGDYEKCNKCLTALSIRANDNSWTKSVEKIEFMTNRFGRDKSGFTSFWN